MTPDFTLRPVGEADFEPLLDLSVRVLRADLERLDRFMLERRRARMRAVFDPATLKVIEVDGVRAGCIGATPAGDHLEVHSVYLEPAFQRRGLGAAALAAVLAGHAGLPTRIEVLRESPAHRFWEAQGFVRTGEEGVDWLYQRPARLGAGPPEP